MGSFYKSNKPYILLAAIALFMFLSLAIAPLLQNDLTELLDYTSYPVWHNIFEYSTVIISVCIFCVTYYSYDQKQNFRYLLLGSMLLLMGFIDFFHAMSFKGMPDFLIPYTTSNRATTFWIIGRLIGGFGLLAASIVPQKVTLRLNKIFFFIVPVVISLIILDLVTYWPGSASSQCILKEKVLPEQKCCLSILLLHFSCSL